MFLRDSRRLFARGRAFRTIFRLRELRCGGELVERVAITP